MSDVRKLDLNLVVVLDALLTEKNLTRAGERVGMTQPAVSGALTRLRELFDDPLLERTGRGFTLTARATSLVPSVQECIAEVERTFDVLPEFNPATSVRTFVVAASDYVLAELTGPLLSVIEREAPQVRVEFVPLPVEEALSAVDLLRTDVTIAAAGRGVPGKRMSLFSDQHVCLVDAANPALVDGALSIEDLGRLPLVRAIFGPRVQTHVDDMLGEFGMLPPVAMTVRGFLPVALGIPGTNWHGWVPERVAQRYAAAFGLVIARTPVAPPLLVEAAHWHPSKSDDASLQWLVSTLRTAATVLEFRDEPDAWDMAVQS